MATAQQQRVASFCLLDPFAEGKPQGAAGKDFFEQMGIDTSVALRNTTDDLSIKFLEGSMSEATMSQAFTSFAAEAGYGAQSADLGSQSADLGFPERKLLPGENVVARRVTRSFSLIMEAYEHDQTLAAASVPQQQAFPLPDPGTFLPPQHMRILCESDAPPPSIRELYSRYGGNGQSSNLTALSAVDKKKNKPESKIPEIPKKQVDELMRALRHDKESAEAPKKKRASAAPSLKPSKAIKKLHHSPDLEARPRLEAPAPAASEMLTTSYERSLSIGTRILRALERTNTKNITSAADRKAARQKARALKAQKSAEALATMSPARDEGESASVSNQMYADMELLVQHTKSIIMENEKLKTRLTMLNRVSSAQASKLEEQDNTTVSVK
ncbi:hypothetical protein HOP50_06g44770 [Chloropicon primus]|uniref:Uncharacterized protein n=1 Tax=Chloropicon primus TaxID=1764295 RepID=A0A5B8MMZ7_9CHLO|nr:hypothetical protein A3770_06p44540 [Chloropicon primus]UPR01156.1 hypothetical protein HOP50_06g44770 [Chloropicon primus]|mmetsp:Transcript_14438/g.41071  ORF Transcript_14438/g.41071 Transcript_14438/m.41071 type:complete len:386 (-) Transcript_14438:56-1213(-)|eukprot:QDZ21936.1 hypothetical protein A3770_06p44540 [Chloropicon primus]